MDLSVFLSMARLSSSEFIVEIASGSGTRKWNCNYKTRYPRWGTKGKWNNGKLPPIIDQFSFRICIGYRGYSASMILSQFYDIEISCVIRKFLTLCKLMCFLFFRSIRFDGIYIYKICIIYRQKKEKRVFFCLYRLLSCLCNFLFISGKGKYK